MSAASPHGPILSGQTVEMSPEPTCPGAVTVPCSRCDAPTWLGPRLQAQLEANPSATVICILCVALDNELMRNVNVQSLGNPEA